MPKGGLNWVDVSPEHFSSGVKKEPDFSRIVVRFFEGKSLLASDVETGKSDPVCFVWLGGKDETQPIWEKVDDLNALDNRVVMTTVSPTTCDPKWNQDLTFPLEVDDISQLANMKFVIYVRDEDLDETHKASYDELGMLELNLEDIIAESKGLQFSVMKSASWYPLKKAPGMRRVDGSLRVAISIIFAPTDIPKVTEQLATEIKDSPPNTPLGKLVLKKFNNRKFENSILSKSSTSLFSTTVGRPSSASSANKRKRIATNRPTTAPMLKTSSFMSTASEAIFEESDQIVPHPNAAKDLHPELSVVREEENDDLVSEPGYDKVISQIQQHGKKIEQIMDQRVIKEEELEDLEEELHIIPNNSKMQPVQPQNPSTHANQLSALENHPAIDQSHEDTKSDDFHHELPKGDENLIQEVVKGGVDVLANVITNIDLPDGFDEHLFEVGKAAASVAKKSLSSMKAKASESAVVSGVALRSYKDHIMNTVEKVQDKLSQLGGGGDDNNRNSGTEDSNADIFANGPFLGDNLENPGLEDYENINPEVPLNGMRENMNPETHRESLPNPQQLVRRQSSRQELPPQINQGEMQISEDAFQGNAASVVRILKELHAQRQFMQNTVILLAKANEKGFKHLSGRISKMEKNLTLLNENIKVNEELDDFGFPMIGDQGAPEEFQPKYEEGMKVEVNYRGKGKYFVGKVLRYCGNGTYDVEFDDGDKELKVAEELLRSSGGADNIDESTSTKKLSRTFPSKSRAKGKVNPLNKTTPIPTEKSTKKDYSGFKEFRKQAKKAKNGQVTSYNDDFVVTKKATREPEIEFVYKGERGEVAVAKVASGPVEFARQIPEVVNNGETNTMRISDDPFLLGPPAADQALPDSPNLRSSNPRNNQRYDRSTNRTSLQTSYTNGGFKSPGAAPSMSPSKSALNRDFCDVLDRGTIDDVAHLLESSGTQPEQLSISTRNRLYDVISTLLLQGRNIERCLAWTLALIRGKQNLLRELTIHSQKDLLESLKKVSKEPSKRGMLAHLLISQINRQVSY